MIYKVTIGKWSFVVYQRLTGEYLYEIIYRDTEKGLFVNHIQIYLDNSHTTIKKMFEQSKIKDFTGFDEIVLIAIDKMTVYK